MKSQGGQKRGEAEEEESQEVLNFVSLCLRNLSLYVKNLCVCVCRT